MIEGNADVIFHSMEEAKSLTVRQEIPLHQK